MAITLETPIIDLHRSSLAGLSSAMAKRLAVSVAAYAAKPEAADATVEDLLGYFPMRYEDRSNFLTTDQLYDGIEASVEVYTRVAGGYQVGKNRSRSQPPLYIFELSGSDRDRTSKPVVVWWFLSGKGGANVVNYYKSRFERGTRFVAFGKWEWDARRNTFALKLAKPDELEILPLPGEDIPELWNGTVEPSANAAENEGGLEGDGDPRFAVIHSGRNVPIYRKLGQFQTKRLREIIYAVLSELEDTPATDHLPPELLKEHGLISRAQAIKEVHFPPDGSVLSEYESFRSPAHRRLIFEELFWVSFALRLQRGVRRDETKSRLIEISPATKEKMAAILPFKLTAAQKKVSVEIFSDLTSASPMNRLIQGDVGSGKTIVAFLAMLAAAESGYQSAIMAPTEILADQHFRNAQAIFSGTGYTVGLLTGSMRSAEKAKMRKAIAEGLVQIIVGTHAIIQDGVEFEDLGLAVIDEQHRFGVLQRAELRERGQDPDILVMTATPIPRSLAMTLYGDLDVSVIDELPPGRTPVKTVVLGEDQRSGVYRGIEREVSLGRQVFVVYPLVEESEKLDLKAAVKMHEELSEKVFPQLRVGLLHGKMKPAEKDAVMQQFVNGELNILVSTTVIEVGVDVPNASLMIIEHAERFGLSQLHQMRGRVGRGAEQSFCILLTGDKRTAAAKERLGIMEETNDGFRIAEKDLDIRGEGEILGTRQAGARTFRIANLVRDRELLQTASAAADHYLEERRLTAETSRLIEYVHSDPRFRLGGIG